ncbi:hypothetical protein M9Y10_009147 [Tritrichomonas musculus]|uniref:Uncharacterized protein n=1 Tax=Tritrichomonas musculus TaxID=1915356 RepID=A0ABR2IZX8_9EUKA
MERMRNARNGKYSSTGYSIQTPNDSRSQSSITKRSKKKKDSDTLSAFSDTSRKHSLSKKSGTLSKNDQYLTSFIQTSFSNKSSSKQIKSGNGISSKTSHNYNYNFNDTHHKLVPLPQQSTKSNSSNASSLLKTRKLENDHKLSHVQQSTSSELNIDSRLNSSSNLNDSIKSAKSHKIRVKKLIHSANSNNTSFNGLSSTAYSARPKRFNLSDISPHTAMSSKTASSAKSNMSSGTPEHMKLMFSKTDKLSRLKISQLNESSQLITENMKKGIGVYDYKRNKKRVRKPRKKNNDTDTEVYYYTDEYEYEYEYDDDDSMTEESYSDPETGEKKHRMVKRSNFHYLFKLDPLDPESPPKATKYNKDEFTSESYYDLDYDFDYEYEYKTDEITGEKIKTKVKKINKDKPKVRTKKKHYVPKSNYIYETYYEVDPKNKNKKIKKTRKLKRDDFTSDYEYVSEVDPKNPSQKIQVKRKKYVPKSQIHYEEYSASDENHQKIKKVRKYNKDEFTSDYEYASDGKTKKKVHVKKDKYHYLPEYEYKSDYEYSFESDGKGGKIKTNKKKIRRKVQKKVKKDDPNYIFEEVVDPKNPNGPKIVRKFDRKEFTSEYYSCTDSDGERKVKKRIVPKSDLLCEDYYVQDPHDKTKMIKKTRKIKKDDFTSESYYDLDYDFDYDYEYRTDDETGQKVKTKVKKLNKDKPKIKTKKKRHVPKSNFIYESYYEQDPNDKTKMIKKTRKLNKKDFSSDKSYDYAYDYDFDYDYEYKTDDETGQKIRTKVKKLNKDKPKIKVKRERHHPKSKVLDEVYYVQDPKDKNKMIKKTRKINKDDFTSESYYDLEYDFDYDYEFRTDEETGQKVKTKVKKLNKNKPKIKTKKKRYIPKSNAIYEDYYEQDPKDKNKMIKKTRKINKDDFTSESYYDLEYDFDYDYEFRTDEETGQKVKTKVKKLNKNKPKIKTKKKRYIPKSNAIYEDYYEQDPKDKNKMIKKTRKINKDDFTSESYYDLEYDFDYDYEFRTDEETGQKVKTKVKKLNKNKPKIKTKKKRYIPKSNAIYEDYYEQDPKDKNKMIKKTRKINKDDFTSESYYDLEYDFDYDYEFRTDEETGQKVKTKVKKLNKNKPKIKTKKKRYIPKSNAIYEDYYEQDPKDKNKMIKKTRKINKDDFTSESYYDLEYDFDYDYEFRTDEETGQKVKTKVKKLNKNKPKIKTKKKRHVPKSNFIYEDYYVQDPKDKRKKIKKRRKLNRDEFTSDYEYASDGKTKKKVHVRKDKYHYLQEFEYKSDYEYSYETDKNGNIVKKNKKKIHKKVQKKVKKNDPNYIFEEFIDPKNPNGPKIIRCRKKENSQIPPYNIPNLKLKDVFSQTSPRPKAAKLLTPEEKKMPQTPKGDKRIYKHKSTWGGDETFRAVYEKIKPKTFNQTNNDNNAPNDNQQFRSSGGSFNFRRSQNYNGSDRKKAYYDLTSDFESMDYLSFSGLNQFSYMNKVIKQVSQKSSKGSNNSNKANSNNNRSSSKTDNNNNNNSSNSNSHHGKSKPIPTQYSNVSLFSSNLKKPK